MTNITFDNAVDLINKATDSKTVHKIVNEVARLTYSKIKDNQNIFFTAAYLEKANTNKFMVMIMHQAEKRLREISSFSNPWSLIEKV